MRRFRDYQMKIVRIMLYAVLAVFFVISLPASANGKPERIVSTHVCTDQLLMLLADHERIVSLSHFASDPDMSVMAEEANRFPVNYGFAEEIVVLDPDLIVTIEFGNANVMLMRKLGYRVVEIPVALNLRDIRSNILAVAEAVGEYDRGLGLARDLENRIANASRRNSELRPLLVMYRVNGFTFGKETLVSELIEHAGFRNLASELGISHAQNLPLEILVSHRPDVLMADGNFKTSALANELPNHRALRRAFRDIPRVDLPGKFWVCGTPFVADALEHLANFRSRLLTESP